MRDRWYALEAEGVRAKRQRALRIQGEFAQKWPQQGPPSEPTIESTVNQIDERHKTGYK